MHMHVQYAPVLKTTRLPMMSPTRAPKNREGANRPPTSPPPRHTLVAAILAKSSEPRAPTDISVELRKMSSRLT